MKKYISPEIYLTAFDSEAIEATLTASQTFNNWQAGAETGDVRYAAEVDFSAMQSVDVQF